MAAISAEADDGPLTFWHGSELLYGHADDAGNGGAERMAESHAAAIRVQTLAREGAEVARHTSALSQERLVLQRLEMERQLCGEGLTYLILDVAHPAQRNPKRSLRRRVIADRDHTKKVFGSTSFWAVTM